jgi:hypothetical protein
MDLKKDSALIREMFSLSRGVLCSRLQTRGRLLDDRRENDILGEVDGGGERSVIVREKFLRAMECLQLTRLMSIELKCINMVQLPLRKTSRWRHAHRLEGNLKFNCNQRQSFDRAIDSR